jgi:hypothetical protein
LVFASAGKPLVTGLPLLICLKMQKPNQGSEKKRRASHFERFLHGQPEEWATVHDL